jgi:hypothetical protein
MISSNWKSWLAKKKEKKKIIPQKSNPKDNPAAFNSCRIATKAHLANLPTKNSKIMILSISTQVSPM